MAGPADYYGGITLAALAQRTTVVGSRRPEGIGGGDRMDTLKDARADFAAHLREHQTQLFGYIYSLLRDLDDADDLFQQTSLVLWDKFGQFDSSKSFIAWACGVARFEVSNFLRSRSRHRLYFSDDLAMMLIDAHGEVGEDSMEGRREAIAGCMKRLRPRDQELLDACYGRSARIPEVAHIWGRSTQSIHNSLRRIRRTLFDCMSRSLVREEWV
jgi:RNA polymerase sigma-70 factor, ECF subfamily